VTFGSYRFNRTGCYWKACADLETNPSVAPHLREAKMAITSSVHDASPAATREARIAQRAYELWQQRGCPENSAESDWFEAEQEFDEEREGSDFA